MKRSCVGLAMGALVMVAALLSFPSCGHDRKLVSIQVQPSTALYPTPQSGQVVFTAIGTYIHPPVTRDITKQVTWGTDVPELLQLNYQGVAGAVAPNGKDCGIAYISATAPEGTGGASNIVVGYANVTVNDPTRQICPGGNPTQAVVTVTLAGPSAAGAVTSVPTGINCPSTACGAQFTVDTTIVLTATPSTGHGFVGWSGGCTSTAGTTCSILVPTGSTDATATFN